MKTSLHISAVVDHPEQLASLVEKLAIRRQFNGFNKEAAPADWKTLETSSTETFVSGTISLDDDLEITNMPFITRFLFTCALQSADRYKIEFGLSLS
jgi:hypothetical protein